jgi:hypothetical protein
LSVKEGRKGGRKEGKFERFQGRKVERLKGRKGGRKV